MPPADRLRELESLYLESGFERLQLLAAHPERLQLHVLELLVIQARELRALRQLVLQAQGGPGHGGEGG